MIAKDTHQSSHENVNAASANGVAGPSHDAHELGLSTVEARNNFSEVINHVAYAKERMALTRRGKTIAGIVPLTDLDRAGITVQKGSRHEVSTADARDNFSDVVNRAAYGKERVSITRRGKIVAVVVPTADLERLVEISRIPDGSKNLDWDTIVDDNRRAVRGRALRKPRSPTPS
jgi:prevent-host-death family protein